MRLKWRVHRKTLQKARRNRMSRGSEGQKNGKSMRRVRNIVCQSTADDDDNDAQRRDHGMNAQKHVPRDEAHVQSGRPRLTTSTRCSQPLSKRPFSLKCRDNVGILNLSRTTAWRTAGAQKLRKNTKKYVKAKKSANRCDHVQP